MMKKIILVPIFGALIFTCSFSEQSAFGAGDLESSSPYGLTSSEKALLKNKKNVDSLGQNVNNVKMQVGTIEEQIDGIRSVLSGTNERVNQIDRRLRALESSNLEDKNISLSASEEIKQIRAYVEENRKLQAKNNRRVKNVLNKISALLDEINSNYVSKEELNKSLKQNFETSNSNPNIKQIKVENNKQSVDYKKIPSAKLIKNAKSSFSKGDLEVAKEQYKALIKKNYKPAFSNFMLGEIEYKQKSWAEAVKYYKKSVEIYDKASYIPKLLYHTAISFDKLRDTQNANKFYKALKLTYPDSEEAKASPDRK